MDFSIFLTQYKAAKDKEAAMKKHIKTEYVPYATKMSESLTIIKATNYKEVDGKEIYTTNSPMRYFLFMMRMFSLYTDITWEYNIVDKAFDELNKNGAIEMLISCLPEKEYAEFSTVLQMTQDDFEANNRDMVAFLETKFRAFESTINGIMDGLQDGINEYLNKVEE